MGLTHQVAAEQQLGDGGFLDRGGFLVADGLQSFQKLRSKAEAGKSLSGRGWSGGDFEGFAGSGVLAAGQIERTEIHRAGEALAGGMGHVLGGA